MDEYKIKNEQAYEAWFKQKSPELMHVVMKTIAAFANTDGGTLLIGIEDRTKKILGLQADYENLKVDDDDGLLVEIKNQFKHFFGEELYATILSLNSDLTIYPYEGKEICRIDVTPSRTTAIPVKHFKSKLDEFYIRHSNSSELVPSARHFYEDHWNPRMKKYLSTNLT
jgi:predicted HTH transcriptional regulator